VTISIKKLDALTINLLRSSKLLRAGAPVFNKHITTLVNNTIKTSVFPTRLKEAQVVPLHKKKMTL
jgi:hypothetical protein